MNKLIFAASMLGFATMSAPSWAAKECLQFCIQVATSEANAIPYQHRGGLKVTASSGETAIFSVRRPTRWFPPQ